MLRVIYCMRLNRACILTDRRIESVGLFLASFAGMQGITGTREQPTRRVSLWKSSRLRYYSGPIKRIARLAQEESNHRYIAWVKDLSFHLFIRCAHFARFL